MTPPERGEGLELDPAQKFRKKPVEVDAVQFDGDPETVWAWLREIEAEDYGHLSWRRDFDGNYLAIVTLEGVMRADVGDWIIRGVKGEFYPCKPDIFAATYESALTAAPQSSEGRDERDFLIAWLVTILQDGESPQDMLEATMQLAGEDNLSESQQNALAKAILGVASALGGQPDEEEK